MVNLVTNVNLTAHVKITLDVIISLADVVVPLDGLAQTVKSVR